MTRWLDEDELQAWLKLAGVMLKLAPTLDSQLQRDSDLTHFDYLCLAMLSESDERTLRMSELAARDERQPVAALARGQQAREEGLGGAQPLAAEPSRDAGQPDRGRLAGARRRGAPGHVETVRALVFDDLSPEDVAALDRIAGHIVERIEASRLKSTC